MNKSIVFEVLNEKQAAEYIGMSVSYLQHDRCYGNKNPGPPYLKLGRSIRYRLSDLNDWLERHLICTDR